MSLGERKKLAADMWENLGRTFAEFFHLKRIVAEGRIRFEPEARFDEIARGGPFVVCGLHLGNWEIVAHAGKRMGVPLTGVYQRLSNPYVDAETRKLRALLYEGGLLPKAAGDGARPSAQGAGGRLPGLPRRPARRPRRQGSLLRPSGAVEHLSRAARAHDRPAALRRRRLPTAGRALRHPHRAGAGPG